MQPEPGQRSRHVGHPPGAGSHTARPGLGAADRGAGEAGEDDVQEDRAGEEDVALGIPGGTQPAQWVDGPVVVDPVVVHHRAVVPDHRRVVADHHPVVVDHRALPGCDAIRPVCPISLPGCCYQRGRAGPVQSSAMGSAMAFLEGSRCGEVPGGDGDPQQVGGDSQFTGESRVAGLPCEGLRVGIALREVRQYQMPYVRIPGHPSRLTGSQVAVVDGQLRILVEEGRLDDEEIAAVGERVHPVAQPGVHDEREPLPAAALH